MLQSVASCDSTAGKTATPRSGRLLAGRERELIQVVRMAYETHGDGDSSAQCPLAGILRGRAPAKNGSGTVSVFSPFGWGYLISPFANGLETSHSGKAWRQ